jgi:hypothetical protein
MAGLLRREQNAAIRSTFFMFRRPRAERKLNDWKTIVESADFGRPLFLGFTWMPCGFMDMCGPTNPRHISDEKGMCQEQIEFGSRVNHIR